MKRTISILFISMHLFYMCSVDENKSEIGKAWTLSYELRGTDTINVIDGDNKRQGIWIIKNTENTDNILADTVVYFNDSAIYIDSNSNSKEVIRYLQRNRGYKRN